MNTRRLIIMRHGEAELKNPSGDHSRQLTKKGRLQVEAVGAALSRAGFKPDLIVASDARRAMETAKAVNSALPHPVTIDPSHDLYLSGFRGLLTELARIDLTIQSVLVVGHNPGWSDALLHLTGKHYALAPGDAAVLERQTLSWTSAQVDKDDWCLLELIHGDAAP